MSLHYQNSDSDATSTGELRDIVYLRELIARCPPSHPNRYDLLNYLTNRIIIHFRKTGQAEYLEGEISCLRNLSQGHDMVSDLRYRWSNILIVLSVNDQNLASDATCTDELRHHIVYLREYSLVVLQATRIVPTC